MKQSELLFKTQREAPKDEAAVNAQLLIRANFIEKLMAGVYSYLPLGFRVREKIIHIIREEMDAIGGAEMLMPALHPRSVWDKTGRWEGLQKIMYQFEDKAGKEIGLGPTHEEVVALIAKEDIFSYQDLPKAVYQIQTKFRNEPRAKSGLLRGREFTMKDLYSFHTDEASLNEFYEKAKKAYKNVFDRCSLKSFITEASGGDFSKEYSHEFMVESAAGEDEIILCRLCAWAQNKEISKHEAKDFCPSCKEGVLEYAHAIEVGNIFKLGTRFSEPAGLMYKDEKGASRPVVMGSYGIGVERLMGTIVETHHDDAGMIWPESVAPFSVHLLEIGKTSHELQKYATHVYNTLGKENIDVLYDDREELSAGEKFADADLIGIPWRVVVSEKTIVQDKIEVKHRKHKTAELMTVAQFLKTIKEK